jgi:hypothetical protein
VIAHCPHCSRLYETTEEIANEPLWSNPEARWCRKCLGVPERPERLSEHERRLREHYDRPEWS